ncbi:MAG TPA: SAM-dependent chlorinase/fluorinase [Salinimicrobium sp.]|nr:SAM-dependent chlorinase/fluorinase [Salinimicrobium sp.]
MSIITLTTDFGLKDHYVAAVKGAVLKELKNVVIVDVSHSISPFHIAEAAYIIKNAYKNFPDGTIHIIGIDSELTEENKHIALILDNHFFICANNGILSLIASEIRPTQMVEINIHNQIQGNFPVMDVFVKVACHIARGGTLDVIGKKITEVKQLKDFEPSVNADSNQIIGNVVYIDNYGNVITNISQKLFQEIGKGRSFKISARTTIFTEILKTYGEVAKSEKSTANNEGSKLALFNSAGFLELAIYKSNPGSVGSASSLFGLKHRDSITVNFN